MLAILATEARLPVRAVTNEELAGPLGVSPDWIEDRTSLRERRRAAAGEATSDLATVAARRPPRVSRPATSA